MKKKRYGHIHGAICLFFFCTQLEESNRSRAIENNNEPCSRTQRGLYMLLGRLRPQHE